MSSRTSSSAKLRLCSLQKVSGRGCEVESRGLTLPKTKRTPSPYDSTQRPNARRARLPRPSTSAAGSPSFPVPVRPPSVTAHRPASGSAQSGLSSSYVHSSSTTAPSSLAVSAEGTRRESYLDWIRDKYPSFEPRDDYEILTLVGSNYRGPESGIRSWLDNQLKIDLAFAKGFRFAEDVTDPETIARGTQRFIERASALLNMRGSITGVKPKPGTRNVFRRPIPNSPYSIRLFPGSVAQREYCLDFVHTKTGEPVNSPPGFEIWAAVENAIPWLGGGTTRIRSLEHRLGFSAASILPGAEKFVLQDGQTCLLKRPGHKDLQFKVPMRAEGLNLARLDVEQLHFPELV
ncbi:hypothetical protein LXA43DRAFT_906514 [Ganoderma leucocontextum]|nr:hypothetical protein LXA43DRAFT_906514 [Ganoderma leucocontextum]